ncbi:hypothetical protein AMECASPLE_028138 [Ameca splendens]|uniref:Secreted protein n=1 Tax=Ameca splendens TaxID=208324 RepID=A0ABV0Z3P3_9TELE
MVLEACWGCYAVSLCMIQLLICLFYFYAPPQELLTCSAHHQPVTVRNLHRHHSQQHICLSQPQPRSEIISFLCSVVQNASEGIIKGEWGDLCQWGSCATPCS